MRIVAAMIAGCFASAAGAQQSTSFADIVTQAQRFSPRLMELDADVRAAQGHQP